RTWRHVVATLAVATVAFATTPATAQTTDESPTPEDLGWGVSPGSSAGEAERTNFTFEVFPGQVIEDTVSVTNFTDEPIDFRLWSGDGYNTEDGAFAIYGADVAPLDTGSWVTLPVETQTVNPNSRADVPFSITIPANASPGDHVGGIAALNTSSP